MSLFLIGPRLSVVLRRRNEGWEINSLPSYFISYKTGEKNMTTISLRSDDDFKKFIKKTSDSTGLNMSQVIIQLCTKGRISNRSKIQKNQIEILYNANMIRNELNYISSHLSKNKVIDILVLKSLIKIEQYLEEITHGK